MVEFSLGGLEVWVLIRPYIFFSPYRISRAGTRVCVLFCDVTGMNRYSPQLHEQYIEALVCEDSARATREHSVTNNNATNIVALQSQRHVPPVNYAYANNTHILSLRVALHLIK